jgi:hypothetical protein
MVGKIWVPEIDQDTWIVGGSARNVAACKLTIVPTTAVQLRERNLEQSAR